jgi:hypothetical protein
MVDSVLGLYGLLGMVYDGGITTWLTTKRFHKNRNTVSLMLYDKTHARYDHQAG